MITNSEREALWDYLATVIPQSTFVEQEKRRELIKAIILDEEPMGDLVTGPHGGWPKGITNHDNPPGRCIIPEKEK